MTEGQTAVPHPLSVVFGSVMDMASFALMTGDSRTALRDLGTESVHSVVTSPPYFGLRDYAGNPDQIGASGSLAEYVKDLVVVFNEVWRVLDNQGTLWLNLGDTYNSYPANRGPSKGLSKNADAARQVIGSGYGLLEKSRPNKSLLGIPWQVAISLQDNGWILRQDIIWRKTRPMPYSGKDRFTSEHEHIFLFSKRPRYRFNRLPGGDVWDLPTGKADGKHFATYNTALPARCIEASTEAGMTVLDPFSGTGTTGVAALLAGRNYIGVDVEKSYNQDSYERLSRLDPEGAF